MIQTEEPSVKKPVVTKKTKKNEIIPFDTSVKISDGSSEVILSLSGKFEGNQQNLDTLGFAFMSQVMKGKQTIRMKVSQTFHANGQKALLARTINNHASRSGKKIIFDDFSYWSEVSHLISKN